MALLFLFPSSRIHDDGMSLFAHSLFMGGDNVPLFGMENAIQLHKGASYNNLKCRAAVLEESDSAAVGTRKAAGEEDKESVKKKIFIQESDASNFFKKRGKRATKSRDELNAETRQMLIADEQRREYFEEQRNEFENFVKEERKEQQERSREQIEQWRQYHYDGLYPSYMYNRHHI
ncbi:hypothetical protein KIL84_019727 [Mauremys mutica]|uniref:Unique cartilage matrix-associated protein n=1 Tax=Mauremys mutica TaxID=74926 RepID=A0A9D3XVJ5_9SAUR|nr:hypothetical protein KIL84_019727 [Mauremys mutica]